MGQFMEDLAEFRRQHRPWNPMRAGVVAFVLSAAGLIYMRGFMWGATLLLALLLALAAAAVAFYRNLYVLDKFTAKMKSTRGQ
jgi:hypothetical protein